MKEKGVWEKEFAVLQDGLLPDGRKRAAALARIGKAVSEKKIRSTPSLARRLSIDYEYDSRLNRFV